MAHVVETSSWLDSSALPDRRVWALLRVFSDGSAQVLDVDGRCHQFDDRARATLWLLEDEYSPLGRLIEDGQAGPDVESPWAENDRAAVSSIQTRRGADS